MADVSINLGQRILEATRLAVAMHLHRAVAPVGDCAEPLESDQASSQQRARRVVIGRAGPQMVGGTGSGELRAASTDPTTDGRLRAAPGDRSRRSPFPAEGEHG